MCSPSTIQKLLGDTSCAPGQKGEVIASVPWISSYFSACPRTVVSALIGHLVGGDGAGGGDAVGGRGDPPTVSTS